MASFSVCRRPGCTKPAAPGQAYCSRECSPFGNLPERKSDWKRKKKACGCFHIDAGYCADIQKLRPIKIVLISGLCSCASCHGRPAAAEEKR